jgi:hypothetical protein
LSPSLSPVWYQVGTRDVCLLVLRPSERELPSGYYARCRLQKPAKYCPAPAEKSPAASRRLVQRSAESYSNPQRPAILVPAPADDMPDTRLSLLSVRRPPENRPPPVPNHVRRPSPVQICVRARLKLRPYPAKQVLMSVSVPVARPKWLLWLRATDVLTTRGVPFTATMCMSMLRPIFSSRKSPCYMFRILLFRVI